MLKQKELTIRISGEAGQGMQTIGQALCVLYKNSGLHIFANQDYMSRIRGGNNSFSLRVSDKPVGCARRQVDIMVALDNRSVMAHKGSLTRKGILILDKNKFKVTDDDPCFLDVPMYDLAQKIGGSELFVSAVTFGVTAALTGVVFAEVKKVLEAVFLGKSEDIVNKNIAVAQAGYTLIAQGRANKAYALKTKTIDKPLLLNGNDALALGAIRAGCKFYSAYPMTPSTSIMDVIAHYASEFNIFVEQAEDEIAAINMAIGASFAGCRAMTATSGGGFCLMVEGLSLAGMTETPVVIVDAQRPAPATGFPTRTEQSDLNFLIHAGHGEFSRVVFTPGTIEEVFYLTVKAFNIADRYQIPVLIMTDQYLADSYRAVQPFDLKTAQAVQGLISKNEGKNITSYKRYAFTDSGISPRAVPSWIAEVIYVDSDEHTEEGHITEDAQIRIAMVEKRFHKKMLALKKEMVKPIPHNLEKADVVLVGFGSTYGVIEEAVRVLDNKRIGCLHLPQVWPFPESAVRRFLQKAKKIITIENNAGAQLAGLIRRETGIETRGSLLKYDGRPFDLDSVVDYVRKEAKIA